MGPLVQRVKGMLVAPAAEWPVIAREPGDPSVLFRRYVAVLALIPALARLVGASLIGGYTPIFSGMITAISGYLLTFAVVYAVALIVNRLAPRFGAQRNFKNALRLTVYSYTPAWLAGIFLLVPGLSYLTILGLYGLYLLWSGLPLLMQAPPERALPYTMAVGGCALILAILLGAIEMAVVSPR
jgi:hypothetical protein